MPELKTKKQNSENHVVLAGNFDSKALILFWACESF
jgi:hypothetical protein